jgi:hypothetical protein
MFIDDRWLAAAIDETLQNIIDVGTAHAAGELAVAERASAPFAKQIVVLAIERTATVEVADGAHALFDRLPAF